MNKATILYKRVVRSMAVFVALSVVPLAVHVVQAGAIPEPGALTYAGVLTDAGGVALPSPQDIEISLWDDPTSGTQVCSGDFPSTAIGDDGRFELAIPDECPNAIDANPNLWVEVTVGSTTLARTKIGAVPYALRAANASSLDGLPPSAFQQRVDAAGCGTGASISAIAEDGSVTCESDANTTYQAGSGLALNETTLSVASPVLEPSIGYPLASPANGYADHVTTAAYVFCALTYVRYPADAAGTTHWCTVTRNENGTWTLQASSGSDEPSRCGMSCF